MFITFIIDVLTYFEHLHWFYSTPKKVWYWTRDFYSIFDDLQIKELVIVITYLTDSSYTKNINDLLTFLGVFHKLFLKYLHLQVGYHCCWTWSVASPCWNSEPLHSYYTWLLHHITTFLYNALCLNQSSEVCIHSMEHPVFNYQKG